MLASSPLTYAVRTEVTERQLDPPQGWNVRVFSWPDKLVHSDIADLGTLSAQFEQWVGQDLTGWLKLNLKPDHRVVVTTDHGFVDLSDASAIDVPSSEGEERNSPRVVPGQPVSSVDAQVVQDGTKSVSIATSRRWFRAPGARQWRFAHGGSTLQETVVPFARLGPVDETAAQFNITGIPDRIEADEGQAISLSFEVTVTGGPDMFPTVTVVGQHPVITRQVPRGQPSQIMATLSAVEGLTQIRIRLQSGSQRRDFSIPVVVTLRKVKRTTLDFDL